jgi:16S rRNA (guanine966-N2)-methyltransferase
MTTRITGGEHRGRRLRSPRGLRLRPTSEKVRAAIFSMIGLPAVAGARVLDLYAGSGALGIEALSRRAEWVDFVESDARLCRGIRHNLDEMGMADRGRVYHRKASAALEELDARYGLVFADPPYEDDPWAGLMEKLESCWLLEDRAVLVLEHNRRLELAEAYGRVVLSRRRRHGDTVISLYSFEGANG